MDASVGTPTVNQIEAYDAVVVWSDKPFDDPVALGNNLATVVQNGNVGIVTMLFEGWADNSYISLG
eukprot:4140510-Ditylum_brightwellii.AAC.1